MTKERLMVFLVCAIGTIVSGGCVIVNEAVVTVEHISTCRSAFDRVEDVMASQGFKRGRIYSMSRREMAWEAVDEGGNLAIRFNFPSRENIDAVVECAPAKSAMTVSLTQRPHGADESFEFAEENWCLLDGLVAALGGAFGAENVAIQSYPKGNDWNEVRRARS